MATCTSHRGWRWTSCEGECECVSGKGGGRGREEGREGGGGGGEVLVWRVLVLYELTLAAERERGNMYVHAADEAWHWPKRVLCIG